MKTFRFILAVLLSVAFASCSSPLGKSVFEDLTNEEIVEIGKKYNIPGLVKDLADVAARNSLERQFGYAGDCVEYADVTYRDLVDVYAIYHDTARANEYKKQFDANCDLVWARVVGMSDSIVADTSLNKYARFHYECEKKDIGFWSKLLVSDVSMKLDTVANDVDAMGGFVTKRAKNDLSKIDMYYFYIDKGYKDGWVLRDAPTRPADVTDFVSGNYNYSINTLWVKTGKDTIFANKGIWDRLYASKQSILNKRPPMGDFHFSHGYDAKMFGIVGCEAVDKNDFVNRKFRDEMRNRSERATELYFKLFRENVFF